MTSNDSRPETVATPSAEDSAAENSSPTSVENPPVSEEAPAQEIPAQDTTAQEAPAEEASVEEAPAEEAVAEEAPAEEAPAQEAAAEEAAAEEAPAQETAAEEAPAEEAPAEKAPAEKTAPESEKPATPSNKPRAKGRHRPGPAEKPRTQKTKDGLMISRGMDPKAFADAAQWGKIDESGTIFVRENDTYRELGQAAEGTDAEEILALHVRRYLDLRAQVALLEARLPRTTPAEAERSLKKLEEELVSPQVIGDIEALRRRVKLVATRVAEWREEYQKERAAERAAALEERTKIVEAAEAIAAQPRGEVRWKESSAELNNLLEKWKTAQRTGHRLERGAEDALWKRFSHARTTFERARRQFYAELDNRRAEVREKKEELIRLAEELAVSTNWGPTAGAYRDLMERWKAAGRCSRREDDKLWSRFQSAQQRFFDARRAANEEIDREYSANLEKKLAILAEAEKLNPNENLKEAKAKLRDLQDQWDQAGRVPRADIDRVEKRMRAVERKFREVEDAHFRKNDPLKIARVQTMGDTFAQAIARLEKQAKAARARGDEKRARELEADAETKRSWISGLQR